MINSASPQALSTSEALLRTSHRSPGSPFHLPLRPDWLVDWARFFGPENSPTANFSMLIGPHYPTVLRDPTGEFARFFYAGQRHAMSSRMRQGAAIDAAGLAHRDLLSACYAGTLSVPALCRKLRNQRFEMVEEFDVWGLRLAGWLPKDELHFPLEDCRHSEGHRTIRHCHSSSCSKRPHWRCHERSTSRTNRLDHRCRDDPGGHEAPSRRCGASRFDPARADRAMRGALLR